MKKAIISVAIGLSSIAAGNAQALEFGITSPVLMPHGENVDVVYSDRLRIPLIASIHNSDWSWSMSSEFAVKEWRLDGVKVGTDTVEYIGPLAEGEYTIELVFDEHGQEKTQSRTFAVEDHKYVPKGLKQVLHVANKPGDGRSMMLEYLDIVHGWTDPATGTKHKPATASFLPWQGEYLWFEDPNEPDYVSLVNLGIQFDWDIKGDNFGPVVAGFCEDASGAIVADCGIGNSYWNPEAVERFYVKDVSVVKTIPKQGVIPKWGTSNLTILVSEPLVAPAHTNTEWDVEYFLEAADGTQRFLGMNDEWSASIEPGDYTITSRRSKGHIFYDEADVNLTVLTE